MEFLTVALLAASSCVSFAIGMFIFLRPALAIEIQRKFYEKINWKIEPVSMTKEIRNTKIMGLLLVIIAIFTVFSMLTGVLW
ncbi:MAG: hypothetical protein JSW40_01350 [Candidatus Omnitrophota bacterium]|nr:MAG: hypothetical protein JSW40_01350 [Candidatus Omnitrophota bacterium]